MPPQRASELSRFPSVPSDRDELPYRLRQQSLLGEFGRIAMQTRDHRQILQRATELCALGGVDTYRIHKMIAARVTTAR